jgi:hypothetical protein
MSVPQGTELGPRRAITLPKPYSSQNAERSRGHTSSGQGRHRRRYRSEGSMLCGATRKGIGSNFRSGSETFLPNGAGGILDFIAVVLLWP